MEELYTVYALADPNTKKVTYIGCTSMPVEFRLYGHLQESFSALEWVTTRFTHKHKWMLELYANDQIPIIIKLIETEHRHEAYDTERNSIAFIKNQPGNTLINGKSKEVIDKPKVKSKGLAQVFKKHGIQIKFI